ncbi:hypothetical protein HX096_15295 [Empedobacter falsenii]|uniref:hypothetical protein n=1 Tax=Empedobacter falsenii TaxID=343874 RepID=UPI0025775BE5|nr:hypothetical protein [Empedobacter falsenii]MDM1549219.1 hypothetical protein [Empedobacter falsenii]
MARTLTVIDIDGEDVTHLNASIDILDEPVCMNLGVAFMPFMDEEFLFLKEDASPDSTYGINDVETGFVEYLYKIRQANRDKTKLEYTRIAGPNALTKRDRIFIAGTIFPSMAISYGSDFTGGFSGIGKKSANCSTSKFEIKTLNLTELRYLFGETFGEYKAFSTRYISIDNNKIKIFLPENINYDVDYEALLIDFLSNGNKTKIATSYGEFPNLKLYKMATGNTSLQKGCWLTKDRKSKNDTWKNACMYIVEHKLQGVMAPFGQIADFYGLLKDKVAQSKHKTRWLKGAYNLVNDLSKWIENVGFSNFVTNDVETILYELNTGICDYAITQFYDLFYGKYKDKPLDTFEKAYQWDWAFVQHEQGVVAVPIYAKTTDSTIDKYQEMADHDGVKGYGSSVFSKVIPEFDEPWHGKVTDAQFRIDLPMLMLWLDRHKPTSTSFKGKVDKNGYLLEKYKKIIRKYEAK